VHPELSDITFFKTVKFAGFDVKSKLLYPWEMCSFVESKFEEKEFGLNIVKFNTTNMSRCYPKGTRVNSGNYDPFIMWNCGSQMVALNYQTLGEVMFLNKGKFRDNGGCGWLIKPDILFHPESGYDPNHITNSPPCKVPRVMIRIISARQLPRSLEKSQTKDIISPHISVEIHGANCDKAVRKTRQIDKDGFSPLWEETFSFDLARSDLALIYFRVWDHERKIAHNAFPVESLRSGYRLLPLFDEVGRELPLANLFIHISYPK